MEDAVTTLTELDVEQAALGWLSGLGWAVSYGSAIAPETPVAERDTCGQVVLDQRLRDELAALNQVLPTRNIHCAANKGFS